MLGLVDSMDSKIYSKSHVDIHKVKQCQEEDNHYSVAQNISINIC